MRGGVLRKVDKKALFEKVQDRDNVLLFEWLAKKRKTLGADKFSILLNAKGKDDGTPLHFAAFSGNIETVTDLVRAGADLAATDDNGNTPLHYAVFRGLFPRHGSTHESAPEITGLLLRHCADYTAKNSGGKTPLHVAVESYHWGSVVKEIIQHVGGGEDGERNDNLTDDNEPYVRPHVSLSKYLLMRDNDGNTPMHIVTSNSTIPPITVEGLMGKNDWVGKKNLLDNEALLAAQNLSGETPLHKAAQNKHYRLIEHLISENSTGLSKEMLFKIIALRNKNNDNALHYAVQGGGLKTVRAILKGLWIAAHDTDDSRPWKEKFNSVFSGASELASSIVVFKHLQKWKGPPDEMPK